jgi:hypothetical protein
MIVALVLDELLDSTNGKKSWLCIFFSFLSGIFQVIFSESKWILNTTLSVEFSNAFSFLGCKLEQGKSRQNKLARLFES